MSARLALLRRTGTARDGREFLIRPSSADDAEALVRLRDDIAAEGDLIAAVPGERTAMEEALLLSTLLSEGGLALTLVVAGAVSGQLLVSRRAERFHSHIGELAIIVSKSCRGAGLGRALMETAIDWAQAVGLEKLSLAVFSDNHRAIALYRAIGFVEEGLQQKQILLPAGPRDLLLMGLQLREGGTRSPS